MLTYAIGRGLTREDKCHVDAIVARLDRGGLRFSELVLGIVTSDVFTKRQSSLAAR
jgi:hypothetical protein